MNTRRVPASLTFVTAGLLVAVVVCSGALVPLFLPSVLFVPDLPGVEPVEGTEPRPLDAYQLPDGTPEPSDERSRKKQRKHEIRVKLMIAGDCPAAVKDCDCGLDLEKCLARCSPGDLACVEWTREVHEAAVEARER